MGFTGTPSISGVVPSQVVAGAEYDVTVSGFDTAWTDTTPVSFGDGIMVTRTKAASATSLVVHILVAPTAMADTRDIMVTDGATTEFWRNAFTVLPREQFTALGTANQLSLSVVRLTINEADFEFDPSAIEVTTAPTIPTQVLNVSSKTADTLVFTDLGAATGAYTVTVTSHPTDNFQKRTFTGTNAVTVINSDVHLFDGSPANNDVTTPFQSTAYGYSPSADAGTVIVSVTSSAPDVTPRVSVLPNTGAWADAMPPVTSVPLTPVMGESYYLVVFESTGAVGFSYTLSAQSVPHVPEEEPNDTPGMAKPLTLPEEGDAQLSSLSDVDFFKVSIADADVGKRLHVRTLPGDPMTNLAVEVILPDGITSFTGVQDHTNSYEDVLTNPLPMAGTYFVKITMSTQVISYDASQSHYEVLVTLE
jgi:hypothetical protein